MTPVNYDAIVLLSGGIDSTACLALLRKSNHKARIATLSIEYGQKHKTEIEAAKAVAYYFHCPHYRIELPSGMFKGAGSTLVDADCPNPEMTYEELAASRGVSPTYVPFRNGNLLSAASAFALTYGACAAQPVEIHYGAHAEDARFWAYPDCTPEFNGAMAAAILVGSGNAVRLITPLQFMEKWQIIKAGHEAGAPFYLTYSCYNGGAVHCGKCPTCVARAAAFKKAGLQDPTTYENAPDLTGVTIPR